MNFGDPFGLCPPADNNPYDCPGYLGAFVLLGQASPALQRELLLFLPRNLANIAVGGALGTVTRAAITVTARGTMSAAAQSAAIGRAGELAARIAKNTQRIPSVTGTAAYRVPDALSPIVLSEVKNVARLSLTAQIRDMAVRRADRSHIRARSPPKYRTKRSVGYLHKRARNSHQVLAVSRRRKVSASELSRELSDDPGAAVGLAGHRCRTSTWVPMRRFGATRS